MKGENTYAAYTFALSSIKEEILWGNTFIQFSFSAMLNQVCSNNEQYLLTK